MKDRKETETRRKQRLAKALKANLGKRKAQTRTRDQAQPVAEKPAKV